MVHIVIDTRKMQTFIQKLQYLQNIIIGNVSISTISIIEHFINSIIIELATFLQHIGLFPFNCSLNTGVWEYIETTRDQVRDLEHRVRLAKENVEAIRRSMEEWSHTSLYQRKEDKNNTLLNLEVTWKMWDQTCRQCLVDPSLICPVQNLKSIHEAVNFIAPPKVIFYRLVLVFGAPLNFRQLYSGLYQIGYTLPKYFFCFKVIQYNIFRSFGRLLSILVRFST